ncbi:cytochrome P450 3A6-like [Dysidea avara]|uniref:cytochrome P450 3A6-like n=1 Tax=Dysidea avara TaxID=196820 RepID=UPI003319C31E
MPVIVTQDPAVIKDVLIRKFDNFVDRYPDKANLLKHVLHANRSLPTVTGNEWRQMRRLLSPGFNGKKLKLLRPIIELSCKQLVDALRKKADTGVGEDVTECFDCFSMEVILMSIFGRKCNLHEESDEMVASVNAAFAKTFGVLYAQEMALTFNSHFPVLSPLMKYVLAQTDIAKLWIPVQDTAAHIIQDRKNSDIKRSDIVQHMLDTKDNNYQMTMFEMVSTAVLIISTGMGHNMTFMGHLLATHPEVQDRLIDDIKNYFANNPDATLLDAAENIEYAEMILREVLRLFPAINVLSRYCMETCTTSNGIVIPKGCQVYLPVCNIHRNPAFWPDPDKFDPERFRSNAKVPYDPATYITFGAGPRMCPGKQYSHIKIKMALISMLREFKFVKTEETDDSLPLVNIFQVTPVKHLKVAVVSI